jgi:hypothetical protein
MVKDTPLAELPTRQSLRVANSESLAETVSASAAILHSIDRFTLSLQVVDSSSDRLVDLPGFPAEELLGGLVIPEDWEKLKNATLTTTYSGWNGSRGSYNNQVLRSVVVNITLQEVGKSISQLLSPLTICLALSNDTKKNEKVCLSFYDPSSDKWKCEDKCLTTINSKGADHADWQNLLCGETDHLTSFALLLLGKEEEDQNLCQTSRSETLAWISMGMVAGAILAVALGVIIIELYIRWKHYRFNQFIERTLEGNKDYL